VLLPPCCGYILCNVNLIKITGVLPCLLTAALGTIKITQNTRRRLTSYIKAHVMTMISIPTTWHRNAMTIDMVEIMTSLRLIYKISCKRSVVASISSVDKSRNPRVCTMDVADFAEVHVISFRRQEYVYSVALWLRSSFA